MNEAQLKEILEKHKLWLESKGGARANLYNADLRNADLYNADLRNANLYNADLRNADLYNANLYNADLRNADLRNANLYNADLYNADLYNADLREVKNFTQEYLTRICPEFGSFCLYKKASGHIVTLIVHASSRRLNAYGSRKIRVERARALKIETMDGQEITTAIASNHDRSFLYQKGKIVSVDNFCDDRNQECAAGIHGFLTKQEAISW